MSDKLIVIYAFTFIPVAMITNSLYGFGAGVAASTIYTVGMAILINITREDWND